MRLSFEGLAPKISVQKNSGPPIKRSWRPPALVAFTLTHYTLSLVLHETIELTLNDFGLWGQTEVLENPTRTHTHTNPTKANRSLHAFIL